MAANWWSGVLDTVTNVVTNRVIRVGEISLIDVLRIW